MVQLKRNETGNLPLKQSGLNIALVTTFYPPFHFGGDGNYVRQQAHALARRGHRVDVLHNIDAFDMLAPDANREPIEEPPGISVTGLKTTNPRLACLASHQSGSPSVFYHRAVSEFFAKDYDVIHFHNISLVGGPGILQYGRGIKIYTAHEHWLVCPTHILWRHNREPCVERQCIRCLATYRRPPQLWRHTGWLDKCASHVDAFCALSEFSARKHREYGFSSDMVVMPSFLPDAPQKDLNTTHEVASVQERPYFLFVGRLEKIKGVQELIPLFLEDIGADLVIVGAGSNESEVHSLAGNSPWIKFTGQLNQGELRPLYDGATAVILPSLCYEVFPLVALEAFRQGTPIIAHELGPFPEIVDSSQGGLLYKDMNGLSDAIHTLLQQPELRDQYSRDSRHNYEKHWSEEQSFRAYFALLRKLADQRQQLRVLDILSSSSDDGVVRNNERAESLERFGEDSGISS